LRRFGIPNAPNPKNKEPPPINFMKSLLEKFEGMIQYNLTRLFYDVSIKAFHLKDEKNANILEKIKNLLLPHQKRLI
jgi:hypothetical protein